MNIQLLLRLISSNIPNRKSEVINASKVAFPSVRESLVNLSDIRIDMPTMPVMTAEKPSNGSTTLTKNLGCCLADELIEVGSGAVSVLAESFCISLAAFLYPRKAILVSKSFVTKVVIAIMAPTISTTFPITTLLNQLICTLSSKGKKNHHAAS